MNKKLLCVYIAAAFSSTSASAFDLFDPLGIRKEVEKRLPPPPVPVPAPPVVNVPLIPPSPVKVLPQVEEKIDQINKAVDAGAEKLGKELVNGVVDTAETARTGKPKGDIAKTAVKVHEDLRKAVEPIETYTHQAVRKLAREAGKGMNDTGATIEEGRVNGDIGVNVAKAYDDTAKEIDRAGRNINDAAIAAGHYIEKEVQSAGQTLSETERTIREGKLVDALWYAAVNPARHTEQNFGNAMMESSLLNDVATALASTYGGPTGAAAYAAYITYKRTGDADLALRSGIIAGLTAKGVKNVNGMPSGSQGEVFKKALCNASIGATAVAASGGDQKAILEAFVKGGSITVAREYYRSTTNTEINGKAPTCEYSGERDRGCEKGLPAAPNFNRGPFGGGFPVVSGFRRVG